MDLDLVAYIALCLVAAGLVHRVGIALGAYDFPAADRVSGERCR